MKILIVHTQYNQKGGEDAVVEAEYKLLSEKADAEVSLKYYKNPTSPLSQIFNLVLEPFNFVRLLKFKKFLRALKPDVVHLHNWHYNGAPAIINAARVLKIPVVQTIHNYRLICPSATLFHNNEIYLNSLNANFPWDACFRKVYRGSFFQTLLLAFTTYLNRKLGTWKSVNRYIFLNKFMQDIYLQSKLELKPSQTCVKPNFIFEKGLYPANIKRNNAFLYVGRLSEEKGITVLLEAFKTVPYTLNIIGLGPFEDVVKDAAAKCDNIKYHGFRPSAYILEKMRECSALLFPSIWYEGMPVTILEAFSTGTAIIASEIGSLKSLIDNKHDGLHFETSSVNSLQATLQNWYNLSDEEKDLYRANAYAKYQEQFSPAKNKHDLLLIYSEVINSNS